MNGKALGIAIDDICEIPRIGNTRLFRAACNRALVARGVQAKDDWHMRIDESVKIARAKKGKAK
jgi:hypothetical protein